MNAISSLRNIEIIPHTVFRYLLRVLGKTIPTEERIPQNLYVQVITNIRNDLRKAHIMNPEERKFTASRVDGIIRPDSEHLIFEDRVYFLTDGKIKSMVCLDHSLVDEINRCRKSEESNQPASIPVRKKDGFIIAEHVIALCLKQGWPEATLVARIKSIARNPTSRVFDSATLAPFLPAPLPKYSYIITKGFIVGVDKGNVVAGYFIDQHTQRLLRSQGLTSPPFSVSADVLATYIDSFGIDQERQNEISHRLSQTIAYAKQISHNDAVVFTQEKNDPNRTYYLTEWCLLVTHKTHIEKLVIFEGDNRWLQSEAR